MANNGMVNFTLPTALQSDDDAPALAALRKYYEPELGDPGFYTGSRFDTWDSTGTRADDVDRFTADDLAVTFLSVEVPPAAGYTLLVTKAQEFSALLRRVGPDRDLADEVDALADGWAGWQLQNALRDLPGIGTTTASKLFARKRPRLRPIWDSVVAAVTGTAKQQWEPMRLALRENDRALHRRLLSLRDEAGLPAAVSATRVLDVLAWLEGKKLGL